MIDKIIQIDHELVRPTAEDVYEQQGIKNGQRVPDAIQGLYAAGLEEYNRTAKPVALLKSVSVDQFKEIFYHSGQNDPDAPLAHIFPRAESLTLFVLTMGPEISDLINGHFRDDIPAGYMLDTIASLGADNSAGFLEDYLKSELSGSRSESKLQVLGYSPGYCGWHISAQSAMFDFLVPQEIGVSLNSSYLMKPIKSVSGVLIAGPAEIHQFIPAFSFCHSCRTNSCVPRLKSLKTLIA